MAVVRILAFASLLAATLPSFAADAVAKLKVGDIPPPMLGHDRKGHDINLDAMHGRVVVVTFWASWCGYCRQELPVLSHIQKLVGSDQLQVIAVNYKESREDYLGFVSANPNINLTYVQDPKGKVSDLYGADGLPNMFIINRDGKIADHYVGYDHDMLQSIVDEIISLLPPDVLKRRAGDSK